MQDSNWKIWAVIAAALVGVSFEMIKRLPKGQVAAAWDQEALQTPANTTTPYSVRPTRKANITNDIMASHPIKVAAQVAPSKPALEKFLRDNAASQTQFEHTPKDGEGQPKAAAKKKKGDDEWEEVTDPKTGKKIRRKKKKKQAKKEEKKEEIKPVVKEEAPKKSNDNDIDSTADEAAFTGAVGPATPPERDDNFLNLEDWIKRLLGRPDVNETKRFIDQYNNRVVSAEIFYKIVDMMIEDSRPEMKRLGVMCAGLTPSISSFQVLAQVIQTERSGSKPRDDAEKHLVRYTDMTNITVLENILRSPTPSYSVVLAAQQLEAAARRHLTLSAVRPSPQPSQASVQTSRADYFRRYIAILQNLSNSKDSSVKDQAGRTLSSLQNLLDPPQPS